MKVKLKLELFLRTLPVYLPFTIIILGISLILGKLVEGIVFTISYTIFRHSFKVEYHKETTFKCLHVSLVVFTVTILFILPKEISLIFACISGLVLNYILSTLAVYTAGIRRSMDKDTLLIKCNNANLDEFEKSILVDFYCYRMRLQDIADKNGYSLERINQLKKKALSKIT